MDIELLPRQWDFVDDQSPWILAYGGRGSAKSTGGGWKVYNRARVPGAREGLYRQRLIDLRGTTLKSMLEGDGHLPPIIPPGTYTHNQQLKTIKIHNGGEIVYNGMDQGDAGRQAGSTGKGSSMNLSGATFDEAVEMNENAVMQVCMSVRLDVSGLPRQRVFMCNPGPPSHWIAKRWGLALGHQTMPGHVSYHLKPTDNYFLPADYIEQLEMLHGVARDRYLLGKWVGSDGLVYDRWNREVHVRTVTAPPRKVLIAVDEGYTDPFAALRLHIDSDGRVHVAREVYESRLTQDEKIERTRELIGSDHAEVIVDSAAPDLIESMRRKGLNSIAANKGQGSVNYGIGLVQGRLVNAGDGQPRLTVDPNCTNTIREFESYEWKPGGDRLKDEPIDANNHALDALRYGCRHLDTGEIAFIYARKSAKRQAVGGLA